jgi:hypothetical protein
MTTYILGAGASLHAGYPLAGQLGSALYNWVSHKKLEHDIYRARIEIARGIYGGLPDLEQILTELDECPPNSRAAKLRMSERGYIRQALLISIPEFFNDLRRNRSPLYDQWARERVQAGDVIITFNYDVACERALKSAGLWEISNGYGFSVPLDTIPQSKVRVLKLHGSTNWWGTIFNGNRGFFQSGPNALPYRPVILFPKDFEFLSYPSELSDPLCGGASRPAAIPALILLTQHKRFYVQTSSGGHEWAEFWSDIWTQAELALQSSDRIVIIGYSMPTADREARELLLKKSNKRARIALYCGERSAHIREEFRLDGFTRLEVAGRGLFEEFLAD